MELRDLFYFSGDQASMTFYYRIKTDWQCRSTTYWTSRDGGHLVESKEVPEEEELPPNKDGTIRQDVE